MADLPVIDLPAMSPRRETVRHLDHACRETGFFYLRGHAVDPALLERVRSGALDFFRAPETRKRQVLATPEHYRGYFPAGAFRPRAGGARDLYQQFKFQRDGAGGRGLVDGTPLQGPNRWPRWLPDFAPAMMAYHDAMTGLAFELLRLFALALGQSERRFVRHFTAPLSSVSLLYYPPRRQGDDTRWGVHPHRDDDAFTILFQDDTGGLEVKQRGGGWIAADPIPDCFLVNIGNMLEIWSGGRFVSTPHRVRNRSTGERLSAPFFAIPDFDSVVEPVAGTAPPFGRIHVGKHMVASYNRNWAVKAPSKALRRCADSGPPGGR